MPKRPKNLSEIYRPPTELCFNGTWDELRLAGRTQVLDEPLAHPLASFPTANTLHPFLF